MYNAPVRDAICGGIVGLRKPAAANGGLSFYQPSHSYMARRMFSPDIVCSDAFLEMPPSSRELYFQLGMRADDDGFVNPRMTMRICGAGEDDLKILIAKKFAIPFDNGIIVIKHWRINNFMRKDRYKPTTYLSEKSLLFVKENQAYSTNPEGAVPIGESSWKKDEDIRRLSVGQPVVNQRSTQDRIGKDRIGINTARKSRAGTEDKNSALIVKVIDAFKEVNPSYGKWYGNKTQRGAASRLIDLHGMETLENVIRLLKKTNGMDYMPTITTPDQLENKWAALEAAMKRKKTEITKRRGVLL